MYLSYRVAKPADYNQCFQVMSERLAFPDEKSRKLLFSFWRHLQTHRAGIAYVVEDHDRPRGHRIVGFCMILFASDEFTQAALTNLPPYISLQAARWWREGRLPFLGSKAIARGNAGDGLNLAAVHYGVEKQKDFNDELQIRGKMLEAGFYLSGGYRIKVTFQETHTLEDKNLIMPTGGRLQRDYSEYPLGIPLDSPARPFLFCIEREEALKTASLMTPLFLYPRPRFGFSLSSQRVLQQALLGETDKEIGKGLGLSIWTVKKRWQEIYGKVEKLERGILNPSKDENVPPGEEPATQRRRLLLTYLRSHLEEIRPYDLVATPRRKKSR